MRYYLYVSETKVDQLYAQIPGKFRDGIATKLTIDLKLIKGEFEGRQPQESLYSKLEIVRNYLDEEGRIGSVDRPQLYFGQVMPLRWGFYPSGLMPKVVYFGGHTKETVVGLGGSYKHLVGNVGNKDPETLGSVAPHLIEVLQHAVEASADLPILTSRLESDPESALRSVERVSNGMRGPSELMEFVAVRLNRLFSPIRGCREALM